MKTDKEGLGGYVGEAFAQHQLQQYCSNSYIENLCSAGFGSTIDCKAKTDGQWQDLDGQYVYYDIKSSIAHKNCAVEVDHPFFKQRNATNYVFVFPFRDEPRIYVIAANALKTVLDHPEHEPNAPRCMSRNGHEYYVVYPEDAKQCCRDKASGSFSFETSGACPTFGEFFHKCFDGVTLEGKSEPEVVKYIKKDIEGKCTEYIDNW